MVQGVKLRQNTRQDSAITGNKMWCTKYFSAKDEIFFLNFSLCTQGVKLRQNVREGVIMGNRSLVLQRLSTANTGLYSCEAANSVGRGRSNTVNLDIKCKNI